MTRISDFEEIKSILADLKKRGYPLEIEVFKTLANFDWTIIPQTYYVDPNTGTGRTVDFGCFSRIDVSSPWFDVLRFGLFIECKHIPKESWVFFTRGPPDHFKDKLRGAMFVTFKHVTKKPDIRRYDCLNHSHIFSFRRFAIMHYTPFGKKRDGGRTDKLFEAYNQVLKALSYDRDNFDSFQKISPQYMLSIYYPIVVCDGKLFEYQIEREEDNLRQIDHISYIISGVSRLNERFMLDVVKKEHLLEFLQQISGEMKKIKEEIEKTLGFSG